MTKSKLFHYMMLEVVFFALAALAALRVEKGLFAWPTPKLFALLLLGGFATFRAARTISYNSVMSWLRAPFCIVVRDTSGAGDSVEPKPGSVFGELLACPICSGTWAAMILLNAVFYVEPLGWALLFALGLAGMSEHLHWSAERDEWQGRAAREDAGTAWLLKNKQRQDDNGYSVDALRLYDVAPGERR